MGVAGPLTLAPRRTGDERRAARISPVVWTFGEPLQPLASRQQSGSLGLELSARSWQFTVSPTTGVRYVARSSEISPGEVSGGTNTSHTIVRRGSRGASRGCPSGRAAHRVPPGGSGRERAGQGDRGRSSSNLPVPEGALPPSPGLDSLPGASRSLAGRSRGSASARRALRPRPRLGLPSKLARRSLRRSPGETVTSARSRSGRR